MTKRWAVLPLLLAVPALAALPDDWSANLVPLSERASDTARMVEARQRATHSAPPAAPVLPGALNPQDLQAAIKAGPHHVLHHEIFDKYTAFPMNHRVIEAIDRIQGQAPDGGGYFTGPHAKPAESPIGFQLSFAGDVLNPSRKRTTSFCTGASYSAFLTAMTLNYGNSLQVSAERLESLKMEEPDGGRREDGVKFWGRWNADDFGVYYALVQYSGMGTPIRPEEAQAGDFMTIGWKNGKSHSAVFLGWFQDSEKGPSMLIWSSQESSNGLGDYRVELSRVHGVKFVRLTNPGAIATFDPAGQPLDKPTWDRGTWFPNDSPDRPRRPHRRR